MLSSHLLHEVERVCNRVAIIDEGRLLYQGAIENLVARERLIKITAEPLEEAYQLLTRDAMLNGLSVNRNGSRSLYVRMRDEDIPRVNALLVMNNIRVSELSSQQATLEDVFLTLTSANSETSKFHAT